MDRKISDEQLDRIARQLLADFAAEEETLDEIAESPRLWWRVKGQIEAEKTRREKGWFGLFRSLVLVFGALVALFCGGLAVWFLSLAKVSNSVVAEQKQVQNPSQEVAGKTSNPSEISPVNDFQKTPVEKKANPPAPEKVSLKKAASKIVLSARYRNTENPAKQFDKSSKNEISNDSEEETKTDFIKLSYTASTDSGQIVRVKVPSSMMVSLGVATNVEKESALVSAEVVIGDDGLARAIRFIR